MVAYTNDLRLSELATGEGSGTWGNTTNTNLELIAEAFSFGTEAITTNADTHTTTIADGASDPGRSLFLKYTGTLDSTCTITIGPNTVSKLWFIENATSGSQDIIISQGSGANVTIANGQTKAIYSDGAGSGAAMVDAFTDLSVPSLFLPDNGKAIFGGGSDLQIYHDGSHSRIDEQGTGVLFLQTNGTNIQLNKGTSENMLVANVDGSVDLYYDNSKKLATTSTGIDVTGSVVSDGLTVSPSGTQQVLATLRANSGAGGGLVVQTDASDDGLIRGYDSSGNIQLQFDTDGGDNYIAQGNVGIGTSSPSAPLDIVSSATGGTTLELDNTSTGGRNYTLYSSGSGNSFGAGNFALYDADAAAVRLLVDSSGNVLTGGGTVSASGLLSVSVGNASGGALVAQDTDGAKMEMQAAGGLGYLGTTSNHPVLFLTNNTEAMRIESGGNVGIGTTSPTSNLDIGFADLGSGSIGFRSTTYSQIAKIVGSHDSGTAEGSLRFHTRTGGSEPERMRIDSSGNVGIGVTDPSSYYAENLVVKAPAEGGITIRSNATTDSNYLMFADGTTGNAAYRGYIGYTHNSPEHFNLVSNGYTRFYTGDPTTERLRILSTGGITFNGDTAQANALDDYEEGTWTLALNTSNSNATISSVNTTGYYTKIGNLVTVNIYNAGANITAAGTGTAQINGLPFTVANGNGYYSTVTFGHTNMCTTQIDSYAAINTNFCVVVQAGTITAAVFATGNPKYMMMSLTYMTSQ